MGDALSPPPPPPPPPPARHSFNPRLSYTRRQSNSTRPPSYTRRQSGSHRYSGAARHSGHSWLQLDLESFVPLDLQDPRTASARRIPDDGNLLSSDDNGFSEDPSAEVAEKPRKKTIGFMLAFLALATVAFVSSLDATTLSVALPVSRTTSEE